MNIVISILGGAAAGIIIGFFIWRGGKKDAGSPMSVFDSTHTDSRTTIKDAGQGIVKTETEEKEKNMTKARAFIAQKDKITNDDIQTYLNISNATTARYLDDLEEEGLLKQIGQTGKYTYYEVING